MVYLAQDLQSQPDGLNGATEFKAGKRKQGTASVAIGRRCQAQLMVLTAPGQRQDPNVHEFETLGICFERLSLCRSRSRRSG